MAQTVKCLSTMRETRVRSLGQEDPLEKQMATHSSILTWRTGTENWKKKKKVSLVCVNIFRMWICAVDLINDDSISIFEFWGFIKLVGHMY